MVLQRAILHIVFIGKILKKNLKCTINNTPYFYYLVYCNMVLQAVAACNTMLHGIYKLRKQIFKSACLYHLNVFIFTTYNFNSLKKNFK